MGLEGQVKLGKRNELAAIVDIQQRNRFKLMKKVLIWLSSPISTEKTHN